MGKTPSRQLALKTLLEQALSQGMNEIAFLHPEGVRQMQSWHVKNEFRDKKGIPKTIKEYAESDLANIGTEFERAADNHELSVDRILQNDEIIRGNHYTGTETPIQTKIIGGGDYRLVIDPKVKTQLIYDNGNKGTQGLFYGLRLGTDATEYPFISNKFLQDNPRPSRIELDKSILIGKTLKPEIKKELFSAINEWKAFNTLYPNRDPRNSSEELMNAYQNLSTNAQQLEDLITKGFIPKYNSGSGMKQEGENKELRGFLNKTRFERAIEGKSAETEGWMSYQPKEGETTDQLYENRMAAGRDALKEYKTSAHKYADELDHYEMMQLLSNESTDGEVWMKIVNKLIFQQQKNSLTKEILNARKEILGREFINSRHDPRREHWFVNDAELEKLGLSKNFSENFKNFEKTFGSSLDDMDLAYNSKDLKKYLGLTDKGISEINWRMLSWDRQYNRSIKDDLGKDGNPIPNSKYAILNNIRGAGDLYSHKLSGLNLGERKLSNSSSIERLSNIDTAFDKYYDFKVYDVNVDNKEGYYKLKSALGKTSWRDGSPLHTDYSGGHGWTGDLGNKFGSSVLKEIKNVPEFLKKVRELKIDNMEEMYKLQAPERSEYEKQLQNRIGKETNMIKKYQDANMSYYNIYGIDPAFQGIMSDYQYHEILSSLQKILGQTPGKGGIINPKQFNEEDRLGQKMIIWKIPDEIKQQYNSGTLEFKMKRGGSVQNGNGEFIGPEERPVMVDENNDSISDYIQPRPFSNFKGYTDDFFNRLWFKESGFDADADSGWAQGYAQFTPETIKELKRLKFVDDDFDVWDAEQSKGASKKYINYLSERPWINRLANVEGQSHPEVQAAKSLMAYNWGPGKFKSVLTKLKEINEGIDIYQNLDWIDKIPLKGDKNYEDYNYEVKKKNKKGEFIPILDEKGNHKKDLKGNKLYEMETKNYFSGSQENTDYVKKLLGLYDEETQNKFEKKYQEGLKLHNIKKYGGEKGNPKIGRLKQQLEKFKQGDEISGLAKEELIKLGLL